MMSSTPEPQSQRSKNLIKVVAPELVQDGDIHFNTRQRVIITTEDKIRLCLHKHMQTMERRQAWVAPLSLLASIVLTLVTATFKDLVLPQATWHAIFIILAGLSIIWLLYGLLQLRRASSIDKVVKEIRESDLNPQN